MDRSPGSTPFYYKKGVQFGYGGRCEIFQIEHGIQGTEKWLGGRMIVIGSMFVRRVVTRGEFVYAPALLEDNKDVITIVVGNSNANIKNITIDVAAEETTPGKTVKYKQPPMSYMGDIHVLKFHGML